MEEKQYLSVARNAKVFMKLIEQKAKLKVLIWLLWEH
tara:strand:+ start:189 stop:299 length:111 start_codon:yes stop_codon:yes gene_type:complete